MIDSTTVCPTTCSLKPVSPKLFSRSFHIARRLAKPVAMFIAGAALCCAQQAQDAPVPSTSLMSEFFEHNYVNFFANGSAIFDTALPQLTSNSSTVGSAVGFDVGGGVSVGHNFKDGTFSFSYRGDYRDYPGSSTYTNGTNQSLSLLLSKRLNRRWSYGVSASGGIVSYGGSFYGAGTGVLTNPLSTQSRFLSAGGNLTYQQSRRLSYTFSGQYFLNNYNYAGAISSNGVSGSASVSYRTTARTTVGGTYSHSYFTYSGSAGNSNIDNVSLNLDHTFTSHWTISASGGFSRSHAQGTITEPVTLLLNQQVVTGYVTGPYNRISNTPSFQGTLSRNMRRTLFSVSGGQGINAGNGSFLTSKNQFVNGAFSITHAKTNLSFGVGYSHLISEANSVSRTFSSSNASASYGWNLMRYVSANIRYDYLHYDALYFLNGSNDSRFTFGLTFSSKSIPLTLF